MRYIAVAWYDATPNALWGPLYFACPDQRHQAGADNTIKVLCVGTPYNAGYVMVGSYYTFNGYIRVQLFNAAGSSATADFDCRSAGPGVNYTFMPNNMPGVAPAPPAGGGGGLCPAPWSMITLANGAKIPAGELYDGAKVLGFDEYLHDGLVTPKVGIVRNPSRGWQERYDVAFASGRHASFSRNHRVVTDKGWVQVQDLKGGDTLPSFGGPGRTVTAVKPIGKSQIVSFQVEGCSTYFAEDIACHNYKP
jgi:hypothetical protein